MRQAGLLVRVRASSLAQHLDDELDELVQVHSIPPRHALVANRIAFWLKADRYNALSLCSSSSNDEFGRHWRKALPSGRRTASGQVVCRKGGLGRDLGTTSRSDTIDSPGLKQYALKMNYIDILFLPLTRPSLRDWAFVEWLCCFSYTARESA